MKSSTFPSALLALALLSSGPVAAADPEPVQQPADVQTRLRGLEDRVAKIEALLQNHAAFNLLKEFEALKSELSRMRGVDEMQAHKIETLDKRQGDLYVDLDKRLEDLNKQARTANAVPPAPPAPPPVVAAAPAQAGAAVPARADAAKAEPARPASAKPAVATEDPLAESSAYEAALSLFKAGNYAGAITDFRAFLKNYPDSTLAANAQYWTGYSYYALKDYKNALAQQQKLVSTWPQSGKVADALLNIAGSQVELNDLDSAKKNLEQIIARYPGTNAAAIAARRLALLK